MRALVLDTETNGREGEELEAIELSYIDILEPHFHEGNANETQRFCPTRESTVGALSVHHILQEELSQQAPSSSCRLPENVEYIIGHGIDYDWEVLKKPDARRICTLAISRALCPELDSHRLGPMMYHLFPHAQAKKQLRDAHSAAADVLMCYQVLITLLSITREEIHTFEALWEFSEQCRVPKTFTFGKHKGMLIEDTPLGYRHWCLNQPDFDPYVLKAIRESMKAW